MTINENIVTTVETEVTETTKVTVAAEPTTAVEESTVTSPILPVGYMADSSFFGMTDLGIYFLKKEYVSDYAKEIARILTNETPNMKAATFNTAYIRELKKYTKKNIAVEERLTTALSLLTTTFKLVASKKAPAILQDIVQAAVEGVYDEKSFDALYRHFDAIYAFLLHYESGGSL